MDIITIGKQSVTSVAAEKSLQDYIDLFDMIPPTNGVAILACDKNLNNGTLIPINNINVTVQNLGNWYLKRYDKNNNCTQTIEYSYNKIAYMDIRNVDSLYTPYGYLTKYTIEPKTAGDKFTVCLLNSCAGMVKLVFAEGSLDEVTSVPSIPNGTNCSIVEIVYPSSVNKVTSFATIIYTMKQLTRLTLPSSVSQATNFSNGLQSNVIEEIGMPATTGKIISFDSVCSGNSKMKKFTFNLGDYNSLTTLANAWNLCVLMDTIENFPTLLNALTTLANAFAGTKLTSLPLPTSLPLLTTMAGMVANCYDLVTLSLPTSASSVTSIAGMGSNLINVETITECTNWGTNQINASDAVTNAYKLTTFKQSAMRVIKIGIYGTSAKVTAITSIDIDYANSTFGGSSPQIDFSYNSLSATEIDRIFTALPTVTGKTIVVKGNPGAATCTPTIATAKGWTVTTA